MTSVRISFVLASYNGESYIVEQITSILSNIGPHDEVIVSDDGSTDATVEKVLGIDDRRIRVLAGGERLGYQGNFARAIAASTGHYVFFSDQDDICLPVRVTASLRELENVACVCGDAIVVDYQLGVMQNSHFATRGAKFSAAWLFAKPSVIGATLACRRDFLMSCLPFPKGVPHDMWLSIQAVRQGSFSVVNDPFILYRRHQSAVSATGSTSSRPIWTRIRERALLLKALIKAPA